MSQTAHPRRPPPVARRTFDAATRALRDGGCVALRADPSDSPPIAIVVAAAAAITPAVVNFMSIHARGIVAVALPDQRARELGLTQLAHFPTNPRRDMRACMVSFDARAGVTTGISAADRARTLRVAADPRAGSEAIVQPGHVVPLCASVDGAAERPGLPDGAVELMRLAGLRPVAAICRVLDEAGEAASLAYLSRWCRRHGLPLVALGDLLMPIRPLRSPLRPR